MENQNNGLSRFEKRYTDPAYEDMVHGLNLTAEQDKELRKLYRRSHLRVRPWGFVFAGALSADFFAGLYAMLKVVEAGDIHNMNWYFALLGAQIVAIMAYIPRMAIADKKLHNRMDEIRREYVRQISR